MIMGGRHIVVTIKTAISLLMKGSILPEMACITTFSSPPPTRAVNTRAKGRLENNTENPNILFLLFELLATHHAPSHIRLQENIGPANVARKDHCCEMHCSQVAQTLKFRGP